MPTPQVPRWLLCLVVLQSAWALHKVQFEAQSSSGEDLSLVLWHEDGPLLEQPAPENGTTAVAPPADVSPSEKAAAPHEAGAKAKKYSKAEWTRVWVRAAVVLGVITVFAGAFGQYHEEIQRTFYIKVEHVCCAAYAFLSVAIDLSIKNAANAAGGKYPFNPACAVVAVEVLKLVASLILFGLNVRKQRAEGTAIVWPGLADVGWLMVPGFVYTCNNMIVFQAIGHCPLGTFGVIRETMLIWNALIWTCVFGALINKMRWFAILLLFAACVANQVPAFFRAEFTWGVCWAFLLAFSNAAGGVANEFAMKRKAAMDINLQNCILYFFCGSFAMIYLAIFAQSSLRAGFFHGFSPQCIQVVWLQVLTGLAVSRILKYVDAVTKTIVAALRGPGVIFVGAIIFRTALHTSEVVATVVVCIACYIYLRQGPLTAPPAEKVAK